MKKIDPSLSEWIDTMHAAYLRRLAQVRVEPTIPLNPPPVPDAEAASSPTPASQKKSEKKSEKKNGKPAPYNA
jgi:hypothetical protein